MDATLNINFVPKDEIKVYYGTEAHVDNNASVFFIKSGQKEIDDYVDAVSKPEINEYVETQAKPLVTQIVNEIAEPTVAEYIENTVKPELDEYVEDKKPELQAYVTQASEYADNSQASATASAASAAAALTSEDNALSSKNAAASSATSASNYANNSKIWAEGTDEQVQALGGSKSAKGWAEASTNLDYTNITNCITAIPQDIKLELNNGTLTLKAGSKVYIPNGAGVFKEIITSKDVSVSVVWNKNGINMLFYNSTNQINSIGINYSNSDIWSGDSPVINKQYGFWYDTTNNIVKYTTNSGDSWISGFSLPICIVTGDSTGITSIDQVFNGFGYIGSHWFELKGNEGIARNGRNVDGSLNNSTRTTANVSVHVCGIGTNNWNMLSGFDGNFRNASQTSYFIQDEMPSASHYFNNYAVWESPRENIIRITSDKGETWTKVLQINCGTYSTVNGRITSFNPKTTIQAVDYYDFKQLDDSAAKLGADNTFTGVNTFEGAYGNVYIKSRNIDLTSKPSSTQYSYLDFYDKNNKRIGVLGAFQFASGEYGIYLQAGNVGSLNIRTNGTNSYTSVATPPTSDNSTQIATTAFVNNFFNTAGKVTTKCMPNYAAGVSISSNYTVPSDGFIFCGLAGNGSELTTINGKRIAVTYDTGVSGSLPQICAPVSKGDVFKTNSQLKWGTFFPCKGA